MEIKSSPVTEAGGDAGQLLIFAPLHPNLRHLETSKQYFD